MKILGDFGEDYYPWANSIWVDMEEGTVRLDVEFGSGIAEAIWLGKFGILENFVILSSWKS